MSKTLEPIFGKIFIKRATAPQQTSSLWTPSRVPEDEGIVLHCGSSTDVKVGDRVKFALRGAAEVQFENEFVVSVDQDQILAIIT